jgi:SAM-dependent methyltransferase
MSDPSTSAKDEFAALARQRYDGTWGKDYQRQKRSIPEQAFLWVSRLRAEKLAPWIQPDMTVLEYGVGQGWNLAALNCRRRLGHDLATFLEAGLQSRGIEFVPDTRPLADGSVDAVICHHTLEHVFQPAEVLREIRRLLRPGGVLLLFVPFEKERRYHRYDPAEPNQHLYSWNVQTLGNLAAATGFEIRQSRAGRFGYDRFAANWAVRLHLGEAGFRGLRFLLHLVKPAREVRLTALRPAEQT